MSSPVASPAEKSDQPKRKRGWRRLLQFRLRAILIFTTLIAIWLGWWLHNARQRRETVAELRKAGAAIVYDFQFHGSPFLAPEERPPYWPAWLVDSLGVDCFANVSRVEVVDGRDDVTDADLQHLKDLNALEALLFVRTQVTDVDLQHLRDLKKLEFLYLTNTQVTDAGLVHLDGLNSLQSLYLDNTQVTDAGLEHFGGLNSLQWLSLMSTQVTDAGLEHLKGHNRLTNLTLFNTQVTDAGVARLQKSLPNCRITH